MNPTSPSRQPGLTTTTTTATSIIRPRNRRLISLDEDSGSRIDDDCSLSTNLVSPFTSSKPSRAVSPIPRKHPSRSVSQNTINQGRSALTSRPLGGLSIGGSNGPTTFASGLWENSWSTLQGLASSVLGNEAVLDGKDKPSAASRRPRRRREIPAAHRRTTSSAPPAQWGPAGAAERKVGGGSRESREALVQAKQREHLLAANGHSLTDSKGKFKRRVSDDAISASAPPAEHEEKDALVYLHHVKPEDTLAGVMIKFSCEPAVFRKANRLWPNDSIQVRKTVILPVEACAVKGKSIPEPAASEDPLNGESYAEHTPNTAVTPWGDSLPSSSSVPQTIISTPASSSTSEHHEDPPWKHDSWVSLATFPHFIEIVRLPRQTLGFFPPNRRKSLSYSDLDTPPVSLDIPRLPYTDISPQRDHHHPRTSSSSYFSAHLQGPGGVGTLGRGVTSPGPAQDGLNKLFAAHLPSVAPRASFESETSTSSTGMENVGGAIEGWMRKLATRAATIVEGPPARDRTGIADLIELSDAFEIGDGGEEEGASGDDESMMATASTARDDQERLLRERFPPRGRAVQDSVLRKKGD
ncbi:MAG: hypothetical protein M1827_003906 [Pycnora praestabilis]|nr:MAG: hypothetical protein M1827_003906 [Pycnora praestabilis]